MVQSLTPSQLKSMFLYVSDRVIAAKEILSEADRNIGDGDHGIGMANGFEGVKAELEKMEFGDVYGIFNKVGRTMIREMGGASGIIFGLLFYGGSKQMPEKSELTTKDFTAIFSKSLAEIQLKGGAKPGDKTMVDALVPAVESMEKSVDKGHGYKELLSHAFLGTERGKEESKKLVARFGKSKALGERAIGYPDAGCVTLTVIFSAMKEWAEENL